MSETNSFDTEFSSDVQKRFLTLLVYEKDWAELDGLELILPEYFENRTLKNICSWIHEHYKVYKTCPTQTILENTATEYVNSKATLTSRDYYKYKEVLTDIFTLTEKESLEFYKDKAVEFAKEVAWKKALNQATSFLKCNDYNKAIKLFSDVLLISKEKDLGIDFSNFQIDNFLDGLRQEYDPKNMIHTGIKGWDKALGGGFVKDNLHLIAAASGGGKSKIMSYLSRYSLENLKRVVFITLELSEQETLTNICMAATGMTLSDLCNPENRERLIEQITNFRETFAADLMIKFYKPATITTNVIRNYIYKVIQRKRDKEGIEWWPDVIFLDYMDKLLPTTDLKGTIYEDNGSVADDCKNLAIDFHCPVISGSQLGRSSWNLKDDEVISMSSIAESAKKAHLAHSLTTINVNPQEKALGRARLYTAKSRSGTTGQVIYIEHNLAKNSFYEINPWSQDEIAGAVNFKIRDTTAPTKEK